MWSLLYVRYVTIKLSKKNGNSTPVDAEISLKFSLMLVCGINITEDIFMDIMVGFWDIEIFYPWL